MPVDSDMRLGLLKLLLFCYLIEITLFGAKHVTLYGSGQLAS